MAPRLRLGEARALLGRKKEEQGDKKDDKQELPSDSAFAQQRLLSWHPICTWVWVALTLMLSSAPFLALGFWLEGENDEVVEYRAQYDGAGADPRYASCQIPPGSSGSGACSITFTVDRLMAAPVFVYYQLTNMYQNHRTYVKSYSNDQLTGSIITDPAKLSHCDPLIERDGKILHPCGLIAQSFFNG